MINIITNQLHTTDCLQSLINNLLHISSRYEKKVKHERLEIMIFHQKELNKLLSKSRMQQNKTDENRSRHSDFPAI